MSFATEYDEDFVPVGFGKEAVPIWDKAAEVAFICL